MTREEKINAASARLAALGHCSEATARKMLGDAESAIKFSVAANWLRGLGVKISAEEMAYARISNADVKLDILTKATIYGEIPPSSKPRMEYTATAINLLEPEDAKAALNDAALDGYRVIAVAPMTGTGHIVYLEREVHYTPEAQPAKAA